MIKRRSLLTAILFAPVIIPNTSLMSLSWRSSKLLVGRPRNGTFEYGEIGLEAFDECALILRQEIDREIIDRILSVSISG